MLDQQVRSGDRCKHPQGPSKSDSVWYLDKMVVRINGERMFMWRAVDKEGEVLDVLVQKRRNKAAAMKLLRKLLKNQGYVPDEIVGNSGDTILIRCEWAVASADCLGATVTAYLTPQLLRHFI